MDNKELIHQYVDAAKLAEETLEDIEALNKRKCLVLGKVKGSNPEFPYESRSFSISGTTCTFKEADKIREQERVLEERYQAAVSAKEAAERFINHAPPRIQRIIRYRYIQGLSWDMTAAKIGAGASEGSIRKELERFLKKV